MREETKNGEDKKRKGREKSKSDAKLFGIIFPQGQI